MTLINNNLSAVNMNDDKLILRSVSPSSFTALSSFK